MNNKCNITVKVFCILTHSHLYFVAMVRQKNEFWIYAENVDGKRFVCKFCGRNFAGGSPRIKAHLSK